MAPSCGAWTQSIVGRRSCWRCAWRSAVLAVVLFVVGGPQERSDHRSRDSTECRSQTLSRAAAGLLGGSGSNAAGTAAGEPSRSTAAATPEDIPGNGSAPSGRRCQAIADSATRGSSPRQRAASPSTLRTACSWCLRAPGRIPDPGWSSSCWLRGWGRSQVYADVRANLRLPQGSTRSRRLGQLTFGRRVDERSRGVYRLFGSAAVGSAFGSCAFEP